MRHICAWTIVFAILAVTANNKNLSVEKLTTTGIPSETTPSKGQDENENASRSREGRSKKIIIVPSQSKFGFPKFYFGVAKAKPTGHGSTGGSGSGWGGNSGGGGGGGGWMPTMNNHGGMGWGMGGGGGGGNAGWMGNVGGGGGWMSMGQGGMGWGMGGGGGGGTGWGGMSSNNGWGTSGTSGGGTGYGGTGWEDSGELESGGCSDKKAQKAAKKAQKKKAKAQKKAQKKGGGGGSGSGWDGWNGANNGGGWSNGGSSGGWGGGNGGGGGWRSDYPDSRSNNKISVIEDVLNEEDEVWPDSLPRNARIEEESKASGNPFESGIYPLEILPFPHLTNIDQSFGVKDNLNDSPAGGLVMAEPQLPRSKSKIKSKKIRAVAMDGLNKLSKINAEDKNPESVLQLKPDSIFPEMISLKLICPKQSWYRNRREKSQLMCMYVRV